MRARAQRAIAECRQIAFMTEEPGHITRRFLTAPMHPVHAHLRARMEALGMTVQVDAAGNLRGLWQPGGATGKRLLLGSHLDTVPQGGAFDGVLGVTLALEWVGLAQDFQLPLPIEVIAFSEEEGVRFGVPFLGSRAVAGRFDANLLALADADGVTVEAAIRAFGLDPGQIDLAKFDPSSAAFVEIHIEQGPVLEAENLRVAAVTAIAGQTRLSVTFAGQANHAGTTPMHLRRDALAAAAEWIGAVEKTAQTTGGLMATVGKLSVEPNAGNVVPGTVQASLDVRHVHDGARLAAVEELLAKATEIAARRRLTLKHTEQLNQPAVPMDERLTAFLEDAIDGAGFQRKSMPCGAGHDAMVMSGSLPATMLLLRSPGGVSHHPGETVLQEDVEACLHVGREFLLRMARNIG
jgi:allantoate deiminase